MNASRILLVEDNRTTSDTLQLFLRNAGYEVEPVFDGQSALDRQKASRFDLILLDLMLPDLHGLTVCRTIRKTSETPIVMLTARVSEEDIVLGLESGADDYVCKPFRAKELLARVRRCLRSVGSTTILATRLIVGELELDVVERKVRLGGEPIRLTKSEFAILSILLRRPGRVFTRDQLITQALGQEFDGSDRTVDTHIWSLRKKLREPSGNPRYIHSEPGVGYRLEDRHET